jgi:phosphatidylglycerophosphate synthase
MTWRCALVLPDPGQGWDWAEAPLLGLPVLIRILVVLHRAGVERVLFPPNAERLRPMLESWQRRRDLPQLGWRDRAAYGNWPTDGPWLGVRGGVVFGSHLIDWFEGAIQGHGTGTAWFSDSATRPVLVSFTPTGTGRTAPDALEDLLPHVDGPACTIGGDTFCRPVDHLERPGNDRELLLTVGKSTDRWHVRWVRGWSFPFLRFLARRGITPNQITWMGFGVGVLACLLIARGRYWTGVAGAVLLYGSWVLDCIDGTLARLTFSESAFGRKLDTLLGHLTNLCIFSALIWAVYGREPVWKPAVYALLILGGISIAYAVSQVEQKSRPQRTAAAHRAGLQGFLDKINHRDYAVWIFLLALVEGFKVFLWCSVVGVQVYWLLHVWLIHKHRRSSAHYPAP